MTSWWSLLVVLAVVPVGALLLARVASYIPRKDRPMGED